PVPEPALPGARSAYARLRDVLLGQLRGLRARVVGPPALRAEAESSQRAPSRPDGGGGPLAPDGRVHAGHVRGTVPRTVLREARLLEPLPDAFPRAAHRRPVVDRARPRPRLPRLVRHSL